MSEGYELPSGCNYLRVQSCWGGCHGGSNYLLRKKNKQFQENSAELDTMGHHCLPTLRKCRLLSNCGCESTLSEAWYKQQEDWLRAQVGCHSP